MDNPHQQLYSEQEQFCVCVMESTFKFKHEARCSDPIASGFASSSQRAAGSERASELACPRSRLQHPFFRWIGDIQLETKNPTDKTLTQMYLTNPTEPNDEA